MKNKKRKFVLKQTFEMEYSLGWLLWPAWNATSFVWNTSKPERVLFVENRQKTKIIAHFQVSKLFVDADKKSKGNSRCVLRVSFRIAYSNRRMRSTTPAAWCNRPYSIRNNAFLQHVVCKCPFQIECIYIAC